MSQAMKTERKALNLAIGAIAFVVASIVMKTAILEHRELDRASASKNLTPIQRVFQRQMKSLTDGDRQELNMVLGHLSDSEARAKEMQLSMLGTRRLTGNHQVERIQLINSMLSYASDSTCARFAMGKISAEEQMTLISALDSANLDRWMSLSIIAMLAEIRRVPPLYRRLRPQSRKLRKLPLQHSALKMLRRSAKASIQRSLMVLLNSAHPHECFMAGSPLFQQHGKLHMPGRSRSLSRQARMGMPHDHRGEEYCVGMNPRKALREGSTYVATACQL